ncbi:helix-turn-helix domain-containing protein [Sanguibacteroides justesenii]|uniref:XRE family transcriptional regulator n=1 Tax=Sanguibacteroides justesenii TaxID=1547597 RepID=A0AB34R121_9PORP|nr:helix-turn-helix transcriptional regulator [Sanguibacteroides justesenii]KIO43521.1 XRE family transcriptional regulator [Sanguibacteroides justesenii]PXZ45222.1 XRE family transcriptional regulator [Sanguibacteroides justesenii]
MKSKIEMYVAQNVRERRMKKDWSQQYIADCLNISQSFISQIESPIKDKAYNIDHLNGLAKIFECSPRDFLPEKPL